MLNYESLIVLTESTSVDRIMIKTHHTINHQTYQLGLLQDNGHVDTFSTWVLNTKDERVLNWLNRHDFTGVSDNTFSNIRRKTNV